MKSARARGVCPGARPGPAQPRSTEVLTHSSFVKTNILAETSSIFWLQNAICYHPWASSTPTTAVTPSKPPIIPPIRPKSYVPSPSS